MNISSILVGLLFIVLIMLIITINVISYLRPSILVSLTPKYGKLINPQNIGNPSQVKDLFLSPSSATILVYIRYQMNNKTPTIGHDDPIRILQLGNSLQLQLSQNNGIYTTKLAIRTQGYSTQTEYIKLNDFPEQKWIHLAIVREGRRYTVYYNGTIAGSDRTQYFPTINSSQFTIGDNRLNGFFALPKLIPTVYRIDDIMNDLKKTSDTRHEPYMPSESSGSFFPSLGCPNGLLCFSTSSQPTLNPLKIWKTPYA